MLPIPLYVKYEQTNAGMIAIFRELYQLSFSHYTCIALHEKVLEDLHEVAVGGHLGENKMLGRLKERFYWPGSIGMCSGMV